MEDNVFPHLLNVSEMPTDATQLLSAIDPLDMLEGAFRWLRNTLELNNVWA